jgi:mono/diheme cytochrome c family protein
MRRLSLARQRQLFCWGGLTVLIAGGLWAWSPGLPVIFGPSARASDIAAGRVLFEHEWTPNDPLAHCDGLGPVFNARSCAGCHFQGGLGGGGEVAHNATSYEVHSRPGDDEFRSGTLHAFSTAPAFQESPAVLKRVYPTIPGRTIRDPSCPSMTFPDFDPVRTESVQPTALFGAGWIDLISDKAVRHNQRSRQAGAVAREMSLDFASVPVGRVPVTADGRVGKFGWKGQFARLADFVAAACADELGLGTPDMPQAVPLAAPGHTSPPDLDKKQFRALLAFVKTLPKPIEAPAAADREVAARGKELFRTVGCAACHVPDLGGVRGVYSDFLLYNLNDPPGSSGASYAPEPPRPLRLPERPDHLPRPEEWKTPPLWGVADSAPYFHDGTAPTLEAAITRHRGDAKGVTARYEELDASDKAAVIAFLKSLKAPPDAVPSSNPAVTRARR